MVEDSGNDLFRHSHVAKACGHCPAQIMRGDTVNAYLLSDTQERARTRFRAHGLAGVGGGGE
jgi:hypothetical protein